MKRQLPVPKGAAPQRLDVFLAHALGYTRSQIQRACKAGRVTRDRTPLRPSYLVQSGDQIEIELTPATAAPPSPPDVPIIYEDQDILVINKPAGLTAHAGAGTAGRATVADYARLHTSDTDPDRPGIVHRLDQDTSGLMILAKTPPAKASLQEQFRGRKVAKTYQLLVVGHPKHEAALISLPVGRDPARPLRQAVVANGRQATTQYQIVATYPGYSLIEAHPQTGRTHQLRVHFASLGHPIAGDATYGPPHRPLGLKRQFLHAAALTFTAPSGRRLKLTAPLPPDLAAVLQRLEKAA